MTRNLLVHPLLVAIFPLLFLYQYNYGHPIPATRVVVWAGASVTTALAVWALAHWRLRDARRSALVASFVTLFLLTYGHWARSLHWLVERATGGELLPGSFWALLAGGLVLAGGVALLSRLRRGLDTASRVANGMATALVVVSLVGAAVSTTNGATVTGPADEVTLAPVDAASAPDIYYIVLDEYANGRILADELDYDNTAFLHALEERGFHVSNRTRANYPMTFLSLTSTLNMAYLDGLAERVGEDATDPKLAYGMLQNNAVMRALDDAGYHVVHFNSGWAGTEWNPQADETVQCDRMSEFDRVFIGTTALAALGDTLLNRELRAGLDCAFRELGNLPERSRDVDAPTFTFAHFVAPHGPYVFDAEGAPRNPSGTVWMLPRSDEARRAPYLEMTTWVNGRVLEAVDQILATSDEPPVIIVQSDHGTNLLGPWSGDDARFLQGRLWNLNALHLPGVDPAQLPDELSNVNTFRLVLNHYLGADLPLLEDRSYFSEPESPYRFRDVTADVRFTEP